MRTARAHRKFAIYSNFLDTILEGEEEILEGETRMDTLKRILKELEETAAELRRMAGMPKGGYVQYDRNPDHGLAVIEMETKEPDQAVVLHAIQNAPTLEELKTYKIVASAGDKTLYDAYCKRIKELSNG